jgi:dynein heavy chain 2
LDKLVGEKSRWVTQVSSLESDLQGLPLASLVTSAFVTYLPMLPEEQRASIQKDWSKLLGLTDYDLCRFMSTESEMLKWKMEGLPADGLSMQNAVIILNSARTPLIIDPSSQAGEWLKTHLSSKGGSFEVTTLHDPRFGNTLELAVRFGKTLIIQEADKLEPVLYPLLRMDLDRQGPRFVVQIGDKAIDYNDTFRLYLVTRNPEPYLPPDARGLVSATNFTVTRSGLEGQLLGLTIQKEQPELEAQKSSLLKQEEELKVQLADLEKSLLETLANSTGNILENKASESSSLILIHHCHDHCHGTALLSLYCSIFHTSCPYSMQVLLDSLTETKIKSTTIATSLTDSKQLQQSLDKQREGYRPIAARGSAMYFLIKDLATINHMYQFSLGSFLTLFKKVSGSCPPT